jgi:hypothetical protein
MKAAMPVPARIAALISAALLIFACAACHEPGNVRRISVRSSTCREIRVIERTGPMPADALAVVDAQGRLAVLPLPRELAEIQEVAVSPDKDMALVVSVGEGHPWINLYRLADWLAPLPPDGEGIEPRLSMDPYPHAWTEIAWRSGREIAFRSSGDYTRFDRATRRPGGSPDDPVRDWIWHTTTDAVRFGGGDK